MGRLRQEMEAAAVRGDQLSMDAIDAEMDECVNLRYSNQHVLGDVPPRTLLGEHLRLDFENF